MKCQHCGEPIGMIGDTWKHAPEDGPDAYLWCNCLCNGCLGRTSQACWPENCFDGEVAEP